MQCWSSFKAVVRVGNTQLRRAVSAAVLGGGGGGGAVDWARLERRVNSTSSEGEIVR